MKKFDKKNIELGALHFPKVDPLGREINFDTLFIPYIYKEIYLEGVYIDALNQKKDLTILDIGGNIGITANYFKDFAKKLYVIEPSPENFAALEANKKFNKWDNVEIFNYALADKDGEMQFAMAANNRTTNALVDEKTNKGVGPGWYDTETFTVQTKSIDTFFEENKIEHVDFCKFDPEGAEELILYSEGFKKVAPKIDMIECEFHHNTWQDIVKYMQSLGYQARRYDSSAIIVLFFR